MRKYIILLFCMALTINVSAQRTIRRQSAPKQVNDNGPQRAIGVRNLAKKTIIILVEFPDQKFSTPKGEIDSMLNGTNYTRAYYNPYYKINVVAEGSARRYFEDQSLGDYSPEFDIIGPVTASQSHAYYSSNNDPYFSRAKALMKEACQKADQMGADFSQYDYDKDGKVDLFYVLYAGYAASDDESLEATCIWPHSSSVSSLTLDGKQLSTYSCSSEMDYYSKQHSGIGTIVHEFSHAIGLPDLYDTHATQGNWKTMGDWDVMDYGNYLNDLNTPAGYSAYEKWFMGWLSPTMLSEAQNDTLEDVSISNEARYINPSGIELTNPHATTDSYYLIENRQKTGWNKYLPGSGLLITKITYNKSRWGSNQVNYNESSMGVDLVEADGSAPRYPSTQWYGKAGDAFPAGATSFTAVSGVPLTDICQQTNGTVTYKVNGGVATSLFQPTHSTAAPRKIWHNGEILIQNGDHLYDLQGRVRKVPQRSRVPAYPGPITQYQPNGDSITVRLHGDEHMHFTTTLDGWQVIYNEKKWFCYAKYDKQGNPIASSRKVKEIEKRSCIDKWWLKRKGIKRIKD